MGIEPMISCMKAKRPGPLDDGASLSEADTDAKRLAQLKLHPFYQKCNFGI